MKGLTPATEKIIHTFSEISILKDYQLVGGTALALQINHRLSEDLDFCQWVPDIHKARYGVDAKFIRSELIRRFGEVEMNHLGFSQVNFLLKEQGVRLTFYHTSLGKPSTAPVYLTGNIHMASLKVLGGSKLYVITQRTQLRDFYDIYVLLHEKHTTLKEMLEQANSLSWEVTPKKIFQVFQRILFMQDDIDRLQILEPKYNLSETQYTSSFRDICLQIERDFLGKK